MLRSHSPGVSFSETMAGPLTLGETDPRAGAALPRGAQSQLTMRATIRIADVRAFVADPRHAGTIDGFIDYPPFAANIPAHGGVFQLFAPSADPALRWMVYELGFEHAGAPYYLAGKKEIRPASIVKMWPATTTLYSRLHRGTDASGAVAAAGILTLGLGQFLRLFATLHALQPEGFADRLRAPAIFGGFFTRELWNTYVLHR
jgi:hypothetical protein